MNPARLAAVRSLVSIRKSRRYANLELDAVLKKSNFSQQDAALFTTLVYGTLEHEITLDYFISRFCNRKPKDISPFLRATLETALFQLFYLNSIPARAVLFDSAEIAKSVEKQGAANLTSAVLHAFLRFLESGEDLFENLSDTDLLSKRYSVPEWIISLWVRSYGFEKAEKICQNFQIQPKPTLHVNLLKTTREQLKKSLLEVGVSVTEHPDSELLLILEESHGDLRNLPGFYEGLFFVQDFSSTRTVDALAPLPGEQIADVCAAPGGKAFSAAIRMKNVGKIFASDLHENRTKLIDAGAERLGIEILKTAAADARIPCKELIEKMDRVLCDVPCSGLGVLAKKPDIRHKTFEEIETLPKVQSEILNAASSLVKNGGTLVYSTCTLNPFENEDVVTTFLNDNREFSLAKEPVTLFPAEDGGDGFFYAVMEKKHS